MNEENNIASRICGVLFIIGLLFAGFFLLPAVVVWSLYSGITLHDSFEQCGPSIKAWVFSGVSWWALYQMLSRLDFSSHSGDFRLSNGARLLIGNIGLSVVFWEFWSSEVTEFDFYLLLAVMWIFLFGYWYKWRHPLQCPQSYVLLRAIIGVTLGLMPVTFVFFGIILDEPFMSVAYWTYRCAMGVTVSMCIVWSTVSSIAVSSMSGPDVENLKRSYFSPVWDRGFFGFFNPDFVPSANFFAENPDWYNRGCPFDEVWPQELRDYYGDEQLDAMRARQEAEYQAQFTLPLTCTRCGTVFYVRPEDRGQRANCTNCNWFNDIPLNGGNSASDALAPVDQR